MSASTIILTKSLNRTLGTHPKSSLIFLESADKIFGFSWSKVALDQFLHILANLSPHIQTLSQQILLQNAARQFQLQNHLVRFSCRILHIISTYSGAYPQSRFGSRLPRNKNFLFFCKYVCYCHSYFSCYEYFTSSRRFMIKQNAITCKKIVSFPIIL